MAEERCAIPGCRAYCRPHQLMCFAHWKMVPREIQRRVWSSDYGTHMRAAIDAIKAVRERERIGKAD